MSLLTFPSLLTELFLLIHFIFPREEGKNYVREYFLLTRHPKADSPLPLTHVNFSAECERVTTTKTLKIFLTWLRLVLK